MLSVDVRWSLQPRFAKTLERMPWLGFVPHVVLARGRTSGISNEISSPMPHCFLRGRYLPVHTSRRPAHSPFSLVSASSTNGSSSTGNPNGGDTSRAEWEALILEFENRSEQTLRADDGYPLSTQEMPARPVGRPLGRRNPEQHEYRALVECAAMTALTAYLWYFGRVLRLDSFIVLFYPLPSLFIMMRWGPEYGNCMPVCTTLFITIAMGPLYGILFALNSAMLIFALGNSLWYQWYWGLSILAGLAAKFVGFFLNILWTSAMLQHNTWKLLAVQAEGLINSAGNAFCRVFCNGQQFGGPTGLQVRLMIGAILALHSIIHVFCTHLSATMILDRLYDQRATARRPVLVPFLRWVKSRAISHYDSLSSPQYTKREDTQD